MESQFWKESVSSRKKEFIYGSAGVDNMLSVLMCTYIYLCVYSNDNNDSNHDSSNYKSW